MRKMFVMAVSATMILAAALFCYEKSSSMISNPFVQLEVLTENTGEEGNLDPAIITCSSGSWGRCFERIQWMDEKTCIFYRDCKWTGYQKDNCPWWWRRFFF